MKLNIYHPSVKERKRIGSAAGGPSPKRIVSQPAPPVKCRRLRHRAAQRLGVRAAFGTPGIAPDESDCATGKNIEDFSWAISEAEAQDFSPDCLNDNQPVRR
jgi:hypothetical protein